jgi:hypothetical protein
MKVGDLVDEANLYSLLCKQYNGRNMKIVLTLNGQKYTIVRIGKNIVNIMFKAEGRRFIFENGSYEVQVDEIQHLCLAESNVVFTLFNRICDNMEGPIFLNDKDRDRAPFMQAVIINHFTLNIRYTR